MAAGNPELRPPGIYVELGLRPSFQVLGRYQAYAEAQQFVIKIMHGVGGAAEDEQDPAGLVLSQGRLAPHLLLLVPAVLPWSLDQSEILYRRCIIPQDRFHADAGTVQVKDPETWQPFPAWVESGNGLVGINIIVVQMPLEAEMPDMGSVVRSEHPGIDGSR